MSPTELQHELEGALIDDSVRVHSLVAAGMDALFKGELKDGSPVMLRFLPEDKSTGPVLDRYLEAQFFEHPRLHRCLRAGRLPMEGSQVIYAVFDVPDIMLAEVLRDHGPLPPDDARKLGLDLVAGLGYLHERGLVHCGLHPWSVARVDDVWKIADYAQMRLAGAGYAAETRKLMTRNWLAPPEAFQGYVTPNWDSWELAQLLRISLEGMPEGRKAGAHVNRAPAVAPPEPFLSIFSSCLDRDPGQRCTLPQIAEALSMQGGAAPLPAQRDASTEPLAARSLTPDGTNAPPPRETDIANSSPAYNPYLGDAYGARADTQTNWRPRIASALAGVLGGLLLLAFLVHDPPLRDGNAEPVEPAGSALAVPHGQTAAPSPTDESGRARNKDAQQPGQGAQAISGVLGQWADATKAGDLARQASFYAPSVTRFFRARNVSRQWIQNYRLRELNKFGGVSSFEISNVQSRIMAPGKATVTLDKTWSAASSKGTSGKVRSELQMLEMDGTWKITSERDIRTYWVKKGKAS